jgi:hypothetical protein
MLGDKDMTISGATEKQEVGTRAGGNVETKGAEQAPDTNAEASSRAGGNVETKSASSGADTESDAKEES